MPTYRRTYYSLEEFAAAAKQMSEKYPEARSYEGREWNGWASIDDACELALLGWQEGLTEAMELVNSALTFVEQERPHLTFRADYDVSGSEVDVSRYLNGVPENMIEYEPITVSRVGRIITLCAGINISSIVSSKNVMRRGAAITALALSLEKQGHEVELWADMSGHGTRESNRTECRILVKGAHDVVDPARIAFAYAHPAAARQLGQSERQACPKESWRSLQINGAGTTPVDPKQDLPEGTIYLPALVDDKDTPNPEQLILSTLRKIGLIDEEAG